MARRRERAAIFASALGQPRHLLDSVRRGLLLVILIAVTPLATANMLQGLFQLQRATEEAQTRLLKGAITSAGSQQNVFASAENVLQALKNVQDVTGADRDCGPTLLGATLSLPFVTNIAVLNRDGVVTCSALANPNPDVSQQSWWMEAVRHKIFSLSNRMVSPVTQTEIIAGTLPLYDPQGVLTGALSIAIDAVWLDNLLKREAPPAEGVAAVVDGRGRPLVSNASSLAEELFAGKDMAIPRDTLGAARDVDGTAWSYAVAPLDRLDLYVAFAAPRDQLFRWSTFHMVVSFVLPVGMVIFTVVAIWLATDRMVMRWLLYLRRVTIVYAQGHYGFRPSRMQRAPSEFRVLGNAIEDMASAIRERDGRLRLALAEKTTLVREIHHRVKNSLQVVVSLLSLYGSGLHGEADRRRFDQLRTRVNTLALVHRILHEADEGSQVRSDELLRELAAMLEAALDRNVTIVVETDAVPLPTDLAVPVGLLTTELVMHLAGETSGSIALTCRQTDDGGVRLALSLRAVLDRAALEHAVPLAFGFAQQIEGRLECREEDGRSTVEVCFRPRRKSM